MSGIGATKTVAIDVDSVLADVMVTWTNEYNKRRNTKINKSEITVWDIPKILYISAYETSELFNYVWKYRWREIPPTEPKIGTIVRNIHSKGYRISILTKRDSPSVLDSVEAQVGGATGFSRRFGRLPHVRYDFIERLLK